MVSLVEQKYIKKEQLREAELRREEEMTESNGCALASSEARMFIMFMQRFSV